MEPANLIAYRLRKLSLECTDQQRMAETVRQLLEADRTAHAAPVIQPADNVIALRSE